jgi:methylmalonyl-CoA mutase C-terminal domain/subunit
VPLLVGGIIPDADRPSLESMGVAGIFGPGASTDEIVAHIRRLVGTRDGE